MLLLHVLMAGCTLTGGSNAIGQGTHKGHDYVDLGLSVKWATCNIGAEQPEMAGYSFAWGETSAKKNYDWTTYSFGNYDHQTRYHQADGKVVLDMADDVAAVMWGGEWRMPTDDEMRELVDECYWVFTADYRGSGECGWIVFKAKADDDRGRKKYRQREDPERSRGTRHHGAGASPRDEMYVEANDVHIFLPSVGIYSGTSMRNAGAEGYYWSSSLFENHSGDAWFLYFNPSKVGMVSTMRYFGKCVRAVCR